ncbi:serine/threonine-protein kinase HipA [Chitinophaga eiseniae]|uniref:Serine/threonine-protein kinase HipA n=1 Tax=Chitinophaga eiseniae TaxID=634771 RepID=A0A1T4RBX7_9BACT|nr:HipA domain-containing protein [Chitinophaga eiseniae]SKA13465.1 serine/threonine-protein kinase HipA [Chitinophaga eiseniae]
MNNRCLYCYQQLEKGQIDFHPRCNREFFGTDKPPKLGYSLEQMADLAANVVQRSVTVPGVQPKLSLTLVKDVLEDGNNGRLTIVGALGGNYILKPPHADYPEMPQNEHLTMRIAELFGLQVVPSSLIRLSSGDLAYITKRIDRTEEGEKIHMLDMFQILEAFDKYKSSMERVGKAIAKYAENTLLDLSNFFELTVFCFLTGNNDMHLKNFSMIVKKDGTWDLAPAYDLLNVAIVNPADKEELALPISARKNKFNRARFMEFGQGLGLTIRQIEGVFSRLLRSEKSAVDLIEVSFLSDEYKQKYTALLTERYDRIRN